MWLWLWILDRDGGDSLFDEACSIRHGGESVAFVGISAVIAMEGGGEVRGVVLVATVLQVVPDEPLIFRKVPGNRE